MSVNFNFPINMVRLPHRFLRSCVGLGLLIVSQFSYSTSEIINFNQVELKTSINMTHPVSMAQLVNKQSKQLILIGENEQKQRLLSILTLSKDDSNYTETKQLIIPDNYLAYDILKSKNKDKLIFQTREELIEYIPEKNQFQPFAKISSIYLQKTTTYLVSRDFSKDLNGDQLDDLLIADFDCIHLLLQKADGTFIRQSVPIQPKIKEDRDSAEFTERPVFFADMNQDSKLDLVVVGDQKLQIYLQNGHSDFTLTQHELILPIEVKPINWWEVRENNGEFIDQSKLSHRNIFDIRDLNNDQITDLIVRFSQSDGVLNKQNNYEIYLGKIEKNQLTYAAEPDSVISADGTISKLELVDLEQDNRSEILIDSLDIGVSQIISALLTGSIDQDVYVFKMDEKDHFQKEPIIEKEVELSFSLSSGKSGTPVVRLADFNGDGVKDFLVSDGDDLLRVYQGTQNKKFLNRKSSKHKISLPKNGELLDVSDLNLDGKDDLVISYATEKNQSRNKLVFLFSQ